MLHSFGVVKVIKSRKLQWLDMQTEWRNEKLVKYFGVKLLGQ
jgi:hypothetical protein